MVRDRDFLLLFECEIGWSRISSVQSRIHSFFVWIHKPSHPEQSRGPKATDCRAGGWKPARPTPGARQATPLTHPGVTLQHDVRVVDRLEVVSPFLIPAP